MKPLRIKMTDTLIRVYDMLDKMEQISVDNAYIDQVDLTNFHSDDYVDCLKSITVDQKDRYADQMRAYSFTDCDCPVFDYMHKYC